MRKTEAQTLGILAIIAVGIIVLCTWGGGQPSLEDMDNQLARAENLESDQEGDSRESNDTLVISRDTNPPVTPNSERLSTEEIINRWVERLRDTGNRITGGLHDLPGDGQENPGAGGETIPPAPEPTTHVVVRGETLSGISQKHFDTVTKWKKILEANKDLISAPEDLQPGMKLVIPKATGTVTSTTTPPTTTLVARTTPPARTYTVKKGDTLYGIAKRFYNSGSRHKELLRANRDQLQTALDLRPGMVIEIPE